MYTIVGEFSVEVLKKYESTYFGELFSIHSAGTVVLDENESVNRPIGWHDFMLIYITKGGAEIFIDKNTYKVSLGDVAVLPPKTIYEIYAADYCEWKFVHFNCNIPFSSFGFPDKKSFRIGEDYEFNYIFERLVNEINNVDYNVNEICSNLGMSLFFRIGRLYGRNKKDIRFEDEMDYVLNIMKNSALGSVDVGEFAKLAGCSEPTFRRRCKIRTGMTPKQYIIKCRIQKIKEMLEIHSGRLEELSSSIGFRDYPYFSKFVKENIGMSPENYVKMVRKDKYKGSSK